MVSSTYAYLDALLGITQGYILPLCGTTKEISPDAINNLPPEARRMLIRDGVLARKYLNGDGVVKEDCTPVLKITNLFVDNYIG